MNSAVDTREWVDYTEGQTIGSNYSSIAYTNVRGKRIETPAQEDILAQIEEIYRTCGRSTPIRLFLKETV